MDICITAHAKERFFERYGYQLSNGAGHHLVHATEDRHGIMLSRYHDGAERWYVLLNGHAVHIVINPTSRTLITCLPMFRTERSSKRRPRKREIETMSDWIE